MVNFLKNNSLTNYNFQSESYANWLEFSVSLHPN